MHAVSALLLCVAAILIILNLFFPHILMQTRVWVTDMSAPMLQLFAQPAIALQDAQKIVAGTNDVRAENTRLQAEVQALRPWRLAAEQLMQENKALKDFLKYKDDATVSYLSARVIALSGGNFNNSVIVTAGARDGVKKDMIALAKDGVIGRVIEVGEWSSRILLLSDLSFRLPVMMEETQQRAILAGDGMLSPKLLYLTSDANIKVGMRIITSGHGGIFPPHLPVGVVRSVDGQNITITPYSALDRLQIVRLVQYHFAGGEANTIINDINKMAPNNPESLSQNKRIP